MRKLRRFGRARRLLLGTVAFLVPSVTAGAIGWRIVQSAARERYRKAQLEAPYDAIIVPGVPFEEDRGRWSHIMRLRVLWSCYLYQQGITKNVIYSGGAVYTPYVEAEVMARYGRALGIPAEHVLTEPLAEHSTENVYYSYELARQRGFDRVALATDPLQHYFVQGFIEELGLPIAGIPLVTSRLETMEITEPAIDAEPSRVTDFVSITDRQGLLTRLRGTAGDNIRFDAYESR